MTTLKAIKNKIINDAVIDGLKIIAVNKIISDTVIDGLKSELHPGHIMGQMVKDQVVAACSGDRKARRWLQTDGSPWLAAVGKYIDEGGKLF